MSHSHLVVTGYVVRGRETLLLRHNKLGMWLPPGGHIDGSELPHEALLREIREETGLRARIAGWPGVQSRTPGVRFLPAPHHFQIENIPDHPKHLDLIYFCSASRGRVVINPKEHSEFRWHGLRELQKSHVRREVRLTALRAIQLLGR